ncbi:MAG: PH domain-containing protein [Acidobacteriota bacterium]
MSESSAVELSAVEHAAVEGSGLGGRRRLAPASVTVARLSGLVTLLVLGILSLPVAVGVLFGQPTGWIWMIGGWVLLMALLAFRALVWPGVRYRHAAWRLDDDGLTIWRGVLVRSITSVPKSRVQHTDVSQGPIQRHFGLATLIVHTAGTQFAAVPLSGLAHDDALAARDRLIDARGDATWDDAV